MKPNNKTTIELQEKEVLTSIENSIDWLHNAEYEVRDLLREDSDARIKIQAAITEMEDVKNVVVGNRER